MKKSFEKWKKSRISPWSERDESEKWLRDCLWLCQACKRGFTRRPMWRNLRQEAHSYPKADICSAHPHVPRWHTHTRINRLWSPLAYGLGGNKFIEHSFLQTRRNSNAHELPAELLRVQGTFFSGNKTNLFDRKWGCMARNEDAVDEGLSCSFKTVNIFLLLQQELFSN